MFRIQNLHKLHTIILIRDNLSFRKIAAARAREREPSSMLAVGKHCQPAA